METVKRTIELKSNNTENNEDKERSDINKTPKK